MRKLLEGIVEFKQNDFESHKELFKDLGKGQSPHTLFIGCCDSRIVPNLITKTMPGELFVVRNIANMVPLFRQNEDFYSTTAAIEYAVKVLEVENIVVCGHSNCGGCAALYKPEEQLENTPYTKKWLELAQPVKEKALAHPESNDPKAREWLTEQINIVEQIKHLFSYPFIKERYLAKKLEITGWYYIIETGEIFCYNKDKGCFEIIN